jgi:hypothetical protein
MAASAREILSRECQLDVSCNKVNSEATLSQSIEYIPATVLGSINEFAASEDLSYTTVINLNDEPDPFERSVDTFVYQVAGADHSHGARLHFFRTHFLFPLRCR